MIEDRKEEFDRMRRESDNEEDDADKTYKVYMYSLLLSLKIVSEYGQEIPQSQTANKPVASRGGATQQSGHQEDKLSKATYLSSSSRRLQN